MAQVGLLHKCTTRVYRALGRGHLDYGGQYQGAQVYILPVTNTFILKIEHFAAPDTNITLFSPHANLHHSPLPAPGFINLEVMSEFKGPWILQAYDWTTYDV